MQINIAVPSSDSAAEWLVYIKALWESKGNESRKAAAREVYDYYRNNQRGYLETELASIYSDPNSLKFKRKWTDNVTKRIVDSLAQVYSAKTKRSIAKKSKVTKKVESLMWGDKDRAMAEAERWTILERTTLVMSKYSNKTETIMYKNFHQFEFDVIQTGSDEKTLQAVILSDFKQLDSANVVVYTNNNTYRFWGGKLIEEINHNLGMLPFVLIHAEDPGFEDYLEPDIGLARSNLEVNIMDSNLLNVVQTQSHGILVMKLPAESAAPFASDADQNDGGGNNAAEGDIRLDIHDANKAVIQMHYGDGGEEPKLETLQFGADIPGIIMAIDSVKNNLGKSYGVEIADTSLNATTGALTATSVWITEKRRRAIQKANEYIFAMAERELFEIAYKQLQMIDRSLPEVDSKSFSVDYINQTSLLDDASIKDMLELKASGDITRVEVIQSLQPSLSEEDSLAKIKTMIENEAKIQEFEESANPAPEPVQQNLDTKENNDDGDENRADRADGTDGSAEPGS